MIKHALRARRFFPYATRKVAASQAVKYAKAVSYLGPRWLFIKDTPRLPA